MKIKSTSLDTSYDIFVSHHNFIIASHLVQLISKSKYKVFGENLSLSDIEHFTDESQASFLISWKNYYTFRNADYLDLKSELLYIPSVSLFNFEEPVIVNSSSLPFTNIEIIDLLSTHS